MTILILLFFCQDNAALKVTVGKPLLFQDENRPETFITGIGQLESDGQNLYILRKNDPSVLVIKSDGTFVRNIGRSGLGPGELGSYAPVSLSVSGPSTWILRDDLIGVNYYENGEFITSFKPKGYMVGRTSLPGFSFGFTQDGVLLQAPPRSRALAYFYGYDGEVKKKVGRILPVEKEFLRVNPALNSTSWIRDGNRWYCLFIYRPIIREFDSDFKLIREINFTGPEILEKEEKFFENKEDRNWRPFPKWHFSDFKIFKNSIYILCEGVLYQLDKKSGDLKSRTYFFLSKEMRAIIDIPRGVFHYLAFTQDGKIFLAHSSLPFDRDGVWTANLPFNPLDH